MCVRACEYVCCTWWETLQRWNPLLVRLKVTYHSNFFVLVRINERGDVYHGKCMQQVHMSTNSLLTTREIHLIFTFLFNLFILVEYCA